MKVTLFHPDGTVQEFQDMSNELDQAQMMEEYHRDQMLWWKKRRQWLQGQIPLEDPFRDFIEGLEEK